MDFVEQGLLVLQLLGQSFHLGQGLLEAIGHHSLHCLLNGLQDIIVNDAEEVGKGFL